jgi:polyisoprenoid-binding protein YceI
MELNRTRTVRTAEIAIIAAIATVLAGCPRPVREPVEPPTSPSTFHLEEPLPPGTRLFRVVPQESLVSILVYRAGKLAKAGHNHVIASHELAGEIAFASDVARSAFALRMPVASLTVDEPALRRAAGEEFAAEVPESARAGTRNNMLSTALLDAEHFPVVALRSQKIEPAAGGALATVQVAVRGEVRTIAMPLRYEQKGSDLLADGELELRQTDLGLTPITALLGALQVRDEMRIRFRVIARAASPAD